MGDYKDMADIVVDQITVLEDKNKELRAALRELCDAIDDEGFIFLHTHIRFDEARFKAREALGE